MNFETVKKRFDEVKTSKEVRTVNPKIQGVIIGLLDKACGSKENRYQFSIALGMAPHSKDWSVGEWCAVSQIVKADKPADKWISSNPNFDSIVGAVMAEIGKNDLQIGMLDETKKQADEYLEAEAEHYAGYFKDVMEGKAG